MSESSSSANTVIYWHGTLPLPLVDYSGHPTHVSIASSSESAKLARRRRFRASGAEANLSWVFTVDEYDIFKAYYLTDLDLGAAEFQMELRYPLNSSLTLWIVKFIGQYEASYIDGNWLVKCTAQLLHPAAVDAQAQVVGYDLFMVMSETTGAEPETFIDVDNFAYSVLEP